MPDEIYDVVDKEGNKISTATWTEVHTKGLLHQVASVLIFKDDSKEEVLIQKRSANMKQHPNLWQHSAGGHILTGQTPDEAIRREIQEEIFHNHDLPDFKINKVCSFFVNDAPGNNEIMHLYKAVYPGPFFNNPKEVSEEPRWIKVVDLQNDMFRNPSKYSPGSHRIMKEYFEAKK